MNRKRVWIVSIAVALIGALGIGIAAQLAGGSAQAGHEPPKLDIAGAAETLGVTEDALVAALGLPDAPPELGQRPEHGGHEPPDLAAAAATLGITEDELKSALGDPSQGRPDLAATAATLGISKDELVAALGLPERPEARPQEAADKPELDLAGAAATLGVSEQALIDALGIPEGGPEQGGLQGGHRGPPCA